ncbi:hypothetical protein [Candidatus Uabimicrobium sp. HlEnr_7]|uniref:hypothetical protein n=1 Tax=Candidatus Uabimicrobium helgolandensis TaxID=3095367 RepID=UPI003556259F
MNKMDSYLKEVMKAANLFYKDEKRVVNELKDHLYEIINAKNVNKMSEKEMWKMVEKEFGDPQKLGEEIASAKGKFLTYCKKSFLSWKSWVIPITIIAIIWTCGLFMRIKTAKISPIIQKDSLVFVWRWVYSFMPGDVVVYKEEKRYKYALVTQVDSDKLVISVGKEQKILDQENVWGKIILQTR